MQHEGTYLLTSLRGVCSAGSNSRVCRNVLYFCSWFMQQQADPSDKVSMRMTPCLVVFQASEVSACFRKGFWYCKCSQLQLSS